jgi:hypothetical protein
VPPVPACVAVGPSRRQNGVPVATAASHDSARLHARLLARQEAQARLAATKPVGFLRYYIAAAQEVERLAGLWDASAASAASAAHAEGIPGGRVKR